MDIRQPIHSEHARTLDTEGLRRHFLVEDLFVADNVTLTYQDASGTPQIAQVTLGQLQS